ncbi:molybdopterin cofactor biosynthesis protein B [Haloactinopolyspora alba]|uniref:Molybdopterin cofactor biosynthesis protein B n=1 Tax=Haloactinopolyspora alba TaxID=648780 RepID=A0A2P8EF85_9ACTN|nr:molybdopterin-guanine dinucleotide biosynthesis protein MobB [Haloactinopolyspora alba]PSL08094.1 molybdopterin cofactor biosynthesis protein B [Haloactinopolyspora alba]
MTATLTTITTVATAETEQAAGSSLEPRRLARAKRAFTTRNVVPLHSGDDAGWSLLSGVDVCPRPGDLVLAEVTELGQHARLERPDGRRARLYAGDEIVVAYGARYAPDQFEGLVPADLGPCDLLAAGGVAGTYTAKSEAVDEPTRLQPRGIVAYRDRRVSLRDWAPLGAAVPPRPGVRRATVLGVAGSAMNAGKTTAMAALIHGLTGAGLRVGAVKVTGTGAGGDLWHYRDAGAASVRDFTDAGYATTYRVPLAELERITTQLLADVAHEVDVVLVEVADGLFQPETSALLASPALREHLDGVLFAAADVLGAYAGVSWLGSHGHDVRAVTGAFTASPLALREARHHLSESVMDCGQLCEPARATGLLPRSVRESL